MSGWSGRRRVRNLDAGSYGRAALLVTLGTPVAHNARDTVLAGALPSRLVARLARGAHRMTVTLTLHQWSSAGRVL